MKKYVLVCVLTIQSAACMFLMNPRVTSVRSYSGHQRYAFNTHAAFGKTHFIVGYQNKQPAREISRKPVIKKKSLKHTTEGARESVLDPDRIVQPFFTSRQGVRIALAELFDQAEQSILIAAFALTDTDIMQRLLAAHKAGITVEIITDFANMNERYSKIKKLAQANIPVYYYNADLNPNPHQKGSKYARMHHKFVVVDQKIGANGSTNYTKSGQKDNIENILVFRDQKTINDFVQEFEHLKKLCERCAHH